MRAKQPWNVIFILLLLLSACIFCEQASAAPKSGWTVIGKPGFSTGEADYIGLQLDAAGTPYVSYQDGSEDHPVVMKYYNSEWIKVGDLPANVGELKDKSFRLNNGIPYVAFWDNQYGNKVSVMKFNGKDWENVGNAGFSAGNVNDIALEFDSAGIPYVSYCDDANMKKVTVKKFDGINWIDVGTPGFSLGDTNNSNLGLSGVAQDIILQISGTTPYVAYWYWQNQNSVPTRMVSEMKFNGSSWDPIDIKGTNYHNVFQVYNDRSYIAFEDYDNSKKATVLSYSGESWQSVGNAGFTPEAVDSIHLYLANDGVPYIACLDDAAKTKVTVMSFTGDKWGIVGKTTISKKGDISFFVHESIPYIAYEDADNLNKSTVMKLIGGRMDKAGPGEKLKQYMLELQKENNNKELRGKIIDLVLGMKSKPVVSDEVIKLFGKAKSILKGAKTADDFNNVAATLEQASVLAPWMPELYYNLGVAYEKANKPDTAIERINLYLLAAPHAKDRENALLKIGELENEVEKAQKEKANMESKYGARHTGFGFSADDLYRYGGITLEMPVGINDADRTIALKIMTMGDLVNKIAIIDIDPSNICSNKIEFNFRGTQYVNIKNGDINDGLLIQMKDNGPGDADIIVRPNTANSPIIHTSIKELLKERAQQAVYAGYPVTLNGKSFYILAQGSSTGSYLFFPADMKDKIDDGYEGALTPEYVVPIVHKVGDETKWLGDKAIIGNINGKEYYFDTNKISIEESTEGY
jgi:hypothetical protein